MANDLITDAAGFFRDRRAAEVSPAKAVAVLGSPVVWVSTVYDAAGKRLRFVHRGPQTEGEAIETVSHILFEMTRRAMERGNPDPGFRLDGVLLVAESNVAVGSFAPTGAKPVDLNAYAESF